MQVEQFRQGDVLLVGVDSVEGELLVGAGIPEGANPVPVSGEMTLAKGSSTGNSHKLISHHAEARIHKGQLVVSTGEDFAQLMHNEHATIVLPPKRSYVVIRQREWVDDAIQNVED